MPPTPLQRGRALPRAAAPTVWRSLALVLLVGTAPAAQGPPAPPPAEGFSGESPAQDPPASGPAPTLDALVVTPSRGPRRLFEAPASSETLGARELLERGYRSTPQALRDLPGVWVQETSVGHGSPYLRGFTGQQNLFLVDGVRLNHSALRPGPNQYWNTVDPFSIERLELVRGPSSVLYGSDAIGGTVQALTRSPAAYATERGLAGFLHYRVASAEESHLGRAETSLALGADTGLFVGLSAKHFGDLRAGSGTGEQPYTGYDDVAGDTKLEHFLGEGLRLVAAHQRVHQRGVPRTHSTIFAKSFEGTVVGTDLAREFDQDRELTYLQLHGADLDGAVDSFSLSASWQRQEEVEDRIRAGGRRDLSGLDVRTLGLWASFGSPTPVGRLSYGLEFYRDFVDSSTERFASQTPADDIQGPVGDDATYDLVGVYLQGELPLTERLELTLGGRFNHAAADARSVRDPVTDERIAVRDRWSSLVGSARFVHQLVHERWALFGGVSQGFRAPNLADLTRFDSAASDEFEIPAPGLDPERYLQYELGLRRRGERLTAQAALFYTDISDQIQRFPTGNVNADGEREVTKANVGDGYAYGLELGAAYLLRPRLELFGNLAWLRSQVETFPTSDPVPVSEPLDREMPTRAQLGLRWDSARADLWAEGLVTWSDDAERLSSRDAADLQRIPPGGTPSWWTLDLRAGKRLGRGLEVGLAVENLTDEDYRVHGSGHNRPGTNLVLSASLSF